MDEEKSWYLYKMMTAQSWMRRYLAMYIFIFSFRLFKNEIGYTFFHKNPTPSPVLKKMSVLRGLNEFTANFQSSIRETYLCILYQDLNVIFINENHDHYHNHEILKFCFSQPPGCVAVSVDNLSLFCIRITSLDTI